MTVRDILQQWLIDNNYDGYMYPDDSTDGQCHCDRGGGCLVPSFNCVAYRNDEIQRYSQDVQEDVEDTDIDNTEASLGSV